MFIDLFGQKGHGKTLKMVLHAKKTHLMLILKKWKGKIVTNIEMSDKIPHEPLDLYDVVDGKLEHCMIYFDEPVLFGTDSRNSGSIINKMWTYFSLTSRHSGNHVWYSMQFMTLVDVRIRSTTDIHIICKKTPYRFIYRYYRPVTFVGAPVYNMIGMQNFKTTYYWREELKEKGIYKLYNHMQKYDLNAITRQMKELKEYIKEKEKAEGPPKMPKKKLPKVPLGEMRTQELTTKQEQPLVSRDVELKPMTIDERIKEVQDEAWSKEDEDLGGLGDF